MGSAFSLVLGAPHSDDRAQMPMPVRTLVVDGLPLLFPRLYFSNRYLVFENSLDGLECLTPDLAA